MATVEEYAQWQLQKGKCPYCKEPIKLNPEYHDEFTEKKPVHERLVDFLPAIDKSVTKAINPVSGEVETTDRSIMLVCHKLCANAWILATA